MRFLKWVGLESLLIVISAFAGAVVGQFIFPAISPQIDYYLFSNHGLTLFGPEYVLIVDEGVVQNPDDAYPGQRIGVHRVFCGWSLVYCIQDRVVPEVGVEPDSWKLAKEDLSRLALVVQDGGGTRGVAATNLKTNTASVYQMTASVNGYTGFSFGCSRYADDMSSLFRSHFAYWGPIDSLISEPYMATDDGVSGYVGLDNLTVKKFRDYLAKLNEDRAEKELPPWQRIETPLLTRTYLGLSF